MRTSLLISLALMISLASALGGYKPISTTNPDVQTAASFVWSTVALKDSRIDLTQGTDLTVVSSTAQVVAGMNYKLLLNGKFNGDQIFIEAIVYKDLSEKLYLNTYQVVVDHYENVKLAADGVVGGYQPIQANDPEVRKITKWLTEKITALTGNSVSDIKVVAAQAQVFAGINYKLTLNSDVNGMKVVLSAVVFKDLQNEYSLRSFTVSNLTSFNYFANVGGFSPKDVNDPEVQNAVVWLSEKIAAFTGNSVSNVKVVSAESQVVAGTNHKLVISAEVNGKTVITTAIVFKSLSGDYSLTSFSITKQSIVRPFRSVGGYSPIDINDPEVQKAVSWISEKITALTGNAVSHVKIVSAQSQVVVGTNYMLTVSADVQSKTVVVSAVVYKNLQQEYSLSSLTLSNDVSFEILEIVGGFKPVSVNDPEVQNAATWVSERIGALTGNAISNIKIISAESQIVAGTNYKVAFSAEVSGKTVIASVVVYKGLTGNYSLTSFTITNETGLKPITTIGGYNPLSINDPQVLTAVNWLSQKITALTGNLVSNLKVISAESQVLAGTNYKLTVSALAEGKTFTIRAVIFKNLQDQFSLSSYTVSNQVDSSFNYLANVGGYTPVDANDPQVQNVVSWLSEKIVTLTGDQISHLNVVSTESQVVAGTNYKLILVVDAGGKSVVVSAVVFKNLAGTYTLSSFTMTNTSPTTTLITVGGYTPADVNDPEVQNVVDWLSNTIQALTGNELTNLKLVSAQKQVVAGTNYQLTISFEAGTHTVQVNATVFKSLSGEHSLTSFKIQNALIA